MSHHGDDREIRAAQEAMLKSMQEQLQGEFPEGRLNPSDEGAVAMGIGHQQGKVVISFPKPIAWIGFTPQQAMDMAESLVEHARACGYTAPLVLRVR